MVQGKRKIRFTVVRFTTKRLARKPRMGRIKREGRVGIEKLEQDHLKIVFTGKGCVPKHHLILSTPTIQP